MIRFFSLLFDNPLGRLGVAAVGLGVLVVSFAMQQRTIGAVKAVATIEKKGEVKRVEAQDARNRARQPGAAARLLKEYCRDC